MNKYEKLAEKIGERNIISTELCFSVSNIKSETKGITENYNKS